MGNSAAALIVVMLGLSVSSCASIVDGSTQPIFLFSTPVSQASCELSNERGTWSVTTPGTVVVKKSTSTLRAVCKKDGWQDGTAFAASTVPNDASVGMAVPYFGVLEAAVDA